MLKVFLSKTKHRTKRRMAFASSAAKPSSVSSSSAFASGEIEGGGEQEILVLKRNNQLLRKRERRERLCNIQKNILAVLILSGAMFLILNVLAKMKEEIKARG